MIIDNAILDNLTAAAKASPRLRMNMDLRNSPADGSQRMLNAIEPGSVMAIHRHRKTSETVVVLRNHKLVKEFGEGVDRMFREMEEAGQPAPEYRQNEFMVYATIRQHGDAVTTEKTTEKILSLKLENPSITTEELARKCDMTTDGVYYHTKRLRERGVLIREGGRKEGHWVIVKKA